MSERRSGDRRRTSTGEVPARGEKPKDDRRGRDRRAGDRRESPRIPLKVWVRDLTAGGSFEQRDGDVGVGGVLFAERHPDIGASVEVRFQLPGSDREILCKGEVLRVTEEADRRRYGAHLRFVDLDVASELAIARFIDEGAGK